MASVASLLIEEVTAHAQSDSLEDAREICADGTYFPNNLRNIGDILIVEVQNDLLPLLCDCWSAVHKSRAPGCLDNYMFY